MERGRERERERKREGGREGGEGRGEDVRKHNTDQIAQHSREGGVK